MFLRYRVSPKLLARVQPGASRLFSFFIFSFLVSLQPLYAQWTDVASSLNVATTGNKDGGVAWADLNNDGFLDLIVNTNNGTNETRLYFWNTGTSAFLDVTTTNAPSLTSNITERSVMAGDIDNDGDIDFMRSRSNLIEVYRNNGAGSTPAYSFTLIQSIVAASFSPTGMNNEGLEWMDFDGDGDLDIFVENHQYGLDIFQNNGTGTFTLYTPDSNSRGFPTGTGNAEGDYSVTADLDNDGHIDIIARRENTSSAIDEVDIWINNGDGTFTSNNDVNLDGDNSTKGGVAVADFDNDGDFDYIYTNNGDNLTSNSSVEIVEQTGLNSLSFSIPTITITNGDDGTLTALPFNENVEGVAISDVNNDGKIDIFLASSTGTSYLLINNTSGQGDFNFIHDNSGVPGTSINPINVSADGEGLAFGDYDNDGDMDFYLNINAGNNQLWQNNIIASPTNYLKVIPEVNLGSGLTRPALGATVTVSDGCELFSGIQEVSGGIGHGSQNDSRLHFGLPNGAGLLYKVEVSFVRPNGGSRIVVTKYVTPNMLTNQTLTVLDTDASDANRQPITVDDNVSTDENTLVTIDVQANDSDPMGETLTTAILTNPVNGMAVLNGDDIDYTPNAGFFGTETFTYTVTNTSGLCAVGTINVTIDAPPLTGYDCRKSITIDATKVSGSSDLTDFPMLVSFTDADLATTANGGMVTSANGYDIAFTLADGTTVLDHELVSYTATTGEYLAWVKIPTLGATSDTQIWMYYGNSAVVTDPSTTNTWDANYEAVLHLQESGNGSDNEFLDATANAHHGTGGGVAGSGAAAGTPSRTTGKFGFSQDFDDSGTQDMIRLNTVSDATWTAVTVQAWINADDTGDDRIFGKSWGTGSNNQTWLLRKNTSAIGIRMRTNTNNNGGFDPFNYSTGTWYLATATWDASDNQLRVYVNGVQQGATTLNGATLYTTPSTNEPTIGNTLTQDRGFDGQLQEARVSDIARSADWLLTEYNSQNDPSTFYSVGPEDCALVLPIELLSFEAEAKTNHVALSWATASEIDNDFFTIERSRDAREFTPLFTIHGAGTSSQTLFYEANDSLPLIGRAFYRLKQTDFDGSFAYSEIVSVFYSGAGAVKIFPNPIQGTHLRLQLDRETTDLSIVIYDISGRKVISRYFNEKPQSSFELDTGSLTTGIYMIRIISELGVHYQKLIVE